MRLRRRHVRNNSSDLLVTSTQVTAVMPSMRYLDGLFGLRCGPQLVESGVYPNAKEYTEAAAMWDACATELATTHPLKDPDTLCVVVGDGSTPRLGTMMALRSAWTVLSVDPALAWSGWTAERLFLVPRRIEDLPSWDRGGECFTDLRRVVVLACHAHVDLPASVDAVGEFLEAAGIVLAPEHIDPCGPMAAVVAMPCCRDLTLNPTPHAVYEDWACLSPKREVRVWREAVLR